MGRQQKFLVVGVNAQAHLGFAHTHSNQFVGTKALGRFVERLGDVIAGWGCLGVYCRTKERNQSGVSQFLQYGWGD
jgi:hypothetical protein